jgi:GNAT superfamily N-acetyltransferase
MDSSLWRALQITLPNGQIVVDVAGSGRFARQVVLVTIHGTSRVISSLPELCDSLKKAETSPKQLAMQDPVGFAYLLSVLSGRPHHILPRDGMWPELEQHFGLLHSTSQPGIEDGIFQFVTYFQYMPVLKVSRIRVDLSTLELKEELLISSPWPPGLATTRVADWPSVPEEGETSPLHGQTAVGAGFPRFTHRDGRGWCSRGVMRDARMEVTVTRLNDLPLDALAPLVAESERDGWRFVRRLTDEWIAGTNRFDRPGEGLFAAWGDDRVVGVCGLNADPYATDVTLGRVRRLYVARTSRGHGIGRRLVQAVIQAARGRFRLLRVRTENPVADRLFERIGFAGVVGVPDCTHVLVLGTDA